MDQKFSKTRQRQMYKDNSKPICQRDQENNRMDDIIKDTIIVSKIDTTFKEIEEGLIKDGNLEKEQIAAEYEAIVRKQLQMLQADERGRLALQNEIGDIRRKQEKRAETLRMRARALEIEKERAKRIANRPPPLPRSVRLLLKEQAKKDLDLATTEHSTSIISPLEEAFEEDIEDKENIDEELLAEKRKLQEEWDKKAKKRFNEALKRDRKKQEHNTILKEIEDAEKLNRRQMARNLSEPTGKVPCYLPDKLCHAEKQVAMEDAVEDVFKKQNTKEHAVEDLEGYEDKWETKYKQIDSVTESRMLDCVPSFVKENYSYLLQEETTLQCGKRFSGLNDSTDLNEAYIESPPADILNNSKEIDVIISQLDQMRLELNEAYEKEFKPLLEAGDQPKIVSHDKSVEANIFKFPTEDKAIEVDRTPPRKDVPLSSKGIQADLLQGGVMSFQRRDLGKIYKSRTNNSSRFLPQSFASQTDSAPEARSPRSALESEARSPRSALESWSSSSYWSLPSKYGLPNACRFCDSPSCSIPLVEDAKLHKDCIPLAKNQNKPSDDMTAKLSPILNAPADDLVKGENSPNDGLDSSAIKTKLASYIRLVADKYLKKPTNSLDAINTLVEPSRTSDYECSKIESKGPTAFSKLKISECVQIPDRRTANTDFVQTSSVSPRQLFQRRYEVDVSLNTPDANDQLRPNLLKSPENALLTIMNSSSEDELLRNCREIIAANISDAFSADNRFESRSPEASRSTDRSVSPDEMAEQQYKKESLTGYVYHDLSTIQEMDSALTNDTKESLCYETQGSRGKKSDLEEISSDEVDTTSVSLVDAPASAASEIAKGIRFIRKPTPEPIEMDVASGEQVPLISGTLSDFQTPPSVTSKVQSTKYKISSIQSISDDQFSNFDSKTPSSGSGTNELLTPSPVSTVKSVSVTKSQGYPYSSSYRDSNATRSHLTSTSALSKYFQDMSSIRQDNDVSSKGLAEAVQMPTKKQSGMHLSSSGAFMPMTPHSYVSTPGQAETYESSKGTFMPMTPHSYLSTPGHITGNQKEQSSGGEIQLSSRENKNYLGIFKTPESNTGSFKPLTPHSYFSSISKITSKNSFLSAKPFSPRKDNHFSSCIGVSSQKHIDDTNPDSFKPLSLISNVSTPNNSDNASNLKNPHHSDKINGRHHNESSASGNFQPMSLHSDISSPSEAHASSYSRLNEISTGKELKKGSINVRLKIPNPFKNKSASPNHMGHDSKIITYPIQLKLDVKDIINSSDNHKMDGADVQRDSSMSNKVSSKIVDSGNTGAKVNKVVSSGFVPNLTVDDFTLSEKNLIRGNTKDIFAANMSARAKNSTSSKVEFSSKSPNRLLHSPNNDVAFSSHKSSLKNSPSTINNDLKTTAGKMPDSTSSVENERAYSSPTRSKSTSPNPILQALTQVGSSAKLHTPCATPINGSSVESLSEMFIDSKITYKSTPIKSVEELIQETGILEEPSLTLMNTELTLKPDSPGKSRFLSECCSSLSDVLKTPSSFQSTVFTPSSLDTPSDTASSPYCDSPSMISFLKHEQSCFAPVIEENRSSVKKSNQNDYKKRTKRLWNNLEEVRTKKLLEERKEQMKKNRLKMKTYSKKWPTPEKK